MGISGSSIPIPSLKKRAAKGAVWITLEMMGVQATSFAVFAAMAHFVEPRDFGLISIGYLVVQSLQMLFLWNITTVVARKQEGTALEYTTTFWISLGVAAFLSAALFALSATLERVFAAPGLAPVLKAMSVVLLFMGLARTHETWLTRHFQFQPLAVRGFAGALAGGVIGLVLATQGFGVMALVGQQVAGGAF
jgi:O-antigen/teichoic acid export membrane protein